MNIELSFQGNKGSISWENKAKVALLSMAALTTVATVAGFAIAAFVDAYAGDGNLTKEFLSLVRENPKKTICAATLTALYLLSLVGGSLYYLKEKKEIDRKDLEIPSFHVNPLKNKQVKKPEKSPYVQQDSLNHLDDIQTINDKVLKGPKGNKASIIRGDNDNLKNEKVASTGIDNFNTDLKIPSLQVNPLENKQVKEPEESPYVQQDSLNHLDDIQTINDKVLKSPKGNQPSIIREDNNNLKNEKVASAGIDNFNTDLKIPSLQVNSLKNKQVEELEESPYVQQDSLNHLDDIQTINDKVLKGPKGNKASIIRGDNDNLKNVKVASAGIDNFNTDLKIPSLQVKPLENKQVEESEESPLNDIQAKADDTALELFENKLDKINDGSSIDKESYTLNAVYYGNGISYPLETRHIEHGDKFKVRVKKSNNNEFRINVMNLEMNDREKEILYHNKTTQKYYLFPYGTNEGHRVTENHPAVKEYVKIESLSKKGKKHYEETIVNTASYKKMWYPKNVEKLSHGQKVKIRVQWNNNKTKNTTFRFLNFGDKQEVICYNQSLDTYYLFPYGQNKGHRVRWNHPSAIEYQIQCQGLNQ